MMEEEKNKIRELVAKFAEAIDLEPNMFYDSSREMYLMDKKRSIRYVLTMCGFPIIHLAWYTGIDHASYSMSNKRFDELLSLKDKRSLDFLKKLLRVARNDIDLDWYRNRMKLAKSDAKRIKQRIDLVNRLFTEIDVEDGKCIIAGCE